MGKFEAEMVISIPPKKVEGWALPVMPGKFAFSHGSRLDCSVTAE